MFITKHRHTSKVEFDRITMDNQHDFVLARVDDTILGAFPNEEWAMEAVAYRLEQRHRTAGSHRPAA